MNQFTSLSAQTLTTLNGWAVLREQWTGWQQMLDNLNTILGQLDPAENEHVELAAAVVRQFRDQARGGGINLGSNAAAALLGTQS